MPLYGEAKRKYQREFVAKRRADWIESQGGCCAKCGSIDRLEVDHIDPTQKAARVSEIWSRNESYRQSELIKCQVLCEECHLDKTLTEGSFSMNAVRHGEGVSGKCGCRCDLCKTKKNAYERQRRASKKIPALTH